MPLVSTAVIRNGRSGARGINGIEYGLMAAYAEGLNILHSATTRESDGRVFGKVLPEGRASLDQLRAERERDTKP